MTIDKAIERLKWLSTEDRYRTLECIEEFPEFRKYVSNNAEVFDLAIDALRAQESHVNLDRSRWNWCGLCEDKKLVRIHTEEGLEYCPVCGKPITEKDWAELERRIGG